MPFIFIVLGLAAMAGGVIAWALFRQTAQIPGQGPAADTDKDNKIDAIAPIGALPGGGGVVGTGITTLPVGVTAMSPAEGNDTIPQRADEGADRFESSPAAALSPTLTRWTADVFPDEDMFISDVELNTRTVDGSDPIDLILWVYDDIVSPRDIAGSPTAGEMGNLETELK